MRAKQFSLRLGVFARFFAFFRLSPNPLQPSSVEWALGTRCTGRNWSKVTKLMEIAEGLEGAGKEKLP